MHRRLDTALRDFETGLNRLEGLDADNQRRFRAGLGRPRRAALSQAQMSILTEGIFNSAFRSFETFVETAFVLYATGARSPNGTAAHSYLAPKSKAHAIQLMQSGMAFLEWNSPEKVISRAELYLRDGAPIKQAITSNRVLFSDARAIRNHIAHDSRESGVTYRRVAARLSRTAPTNVRAPGLFLQETDPTNPTQYFLLSFLRGFRGIANQICP